MRGEPDALRFAAGKRHGRPVEAEVAEAHFHEEVQPLHDLRQNVPRDACLASARFHGTEKAERFHNGHRTDLAKRETAMPGRAFAQGQPHRAGERIEPLPLAFRADGQHVVGPLAGALDFDFAFRLGFAFRPHLEERAETLAGRAPAMWGIEGEETRLQFIEGVTGAGTEELGAEYGLAVLGIERVERAASQGERGVDQATALRCGLRLAEAAQFDADGVLDIAVERLELRGLDPFAVDPEKRVALLLSPFGDLRMEAFAALDQWRKNPQFLSACSGFQARENLGRCLANRGLVGFGIPDLTELGIEETDELEDLRDGGDGALATATRDALFDRDRWRNAGDRIDIGPFELLHELACVGIEAVEVTALAFGEKEVKREGRFPGAAEASDDGHLVEFDINGNVFEIMVTSAPDLNRLRDGLATGCSVYGGFLGEESDLFGRGFGPGSPATVGRRDQGGKLGDHEFSGVAGRGGGDQLGRSGGNDLPALALSFGAEIDEPIGAFEHIEIVLDNDEGIALIDETLQDAEEKADVLEVEPRGGFVEDEEAGLPGGGRPPIPRMSTAIFGNCLGILLGAHGLIAQVPQEFDALGFATGELIQRLAEPQVAESDFGKEGELAINLVVQFRFGLCQVDCGRVEMDAGFIDGHLQNFMHVLAAILDLQERRLEPAAFTDRAGDEDIGQKLHLDFFRAGAVAARAAAHAAVEGKIACGVALGLGSLRTGEEIADRIIRAEIKRGIGSRRAGKRGLVDADHFRNKLGSAQFAKDGSLLVL